MTKKKERAKHDERGNRGARGRDDQRSEILEQRGPRSEVRDRGREAAVGDSAAASDAGRPELRPESAGREPFPYPSAALRRLTSPEAARSLALGEVGPVERAARGSIVAFFDDSSTRTWEVLDHYGASVRVRPVGTRRVQIADREFERKLEPTAWACGTEIVVVG